MVNRVHDGMLLCGLGVFFLLGGMIADGVGDGPAALVLLLPGLALFLGGILMVMGHFGALFPSAVAVETRLASVGYDVVPARWNAEPGPVELHEPNDETTLYDLRQLSPEEFQSWVVEALGGTPLVRKSWDMGIDGYLEDGTPVQVKQSLRVSRPRLDEFETAVRRDKKTRGIMVAISFSPGTRAEARRAREEDGLDIQLIQVHTLLN